MFFFLPLPDVYRWHAYTLHYSRVVQGLTKAAAEGGVAQPSMEQRRAHRGEGFGQ